MSAWVPRFSLDDDGFLRSRRARGTLYANPAAFTVGASRVVVDAEGSDSSEVFRIRLVAASGACLTSGWLSGRGDSWPAALRALALSQAELLDTSGEASAEAADSLGNRSPGPSSWLRLDADEPRLIGLYPSTADEGAAVLAVWRERTQQCELSYQHLLASAPGSDP